MHVTPAPNGTYRFKMQSHSPASSYPIPSPLPEAKPSLSASSRTPWWSHHISQPWAWAAVFWWINFRHFYWFPVLAQIPSGFCWACLLHLSLQKSFLKSIFIIILSFSSCPLWGLLITVTLSLILRTVLLGFPGGSVVKNPPATVEDTGLVPGLGRLHRARGSWACVRQLLNQCLRGCKLQLLKPTCPRACALQREAPAARSSCTAPGEQTLLAAAREKPSQQRRPSTAKNNNNNNK